MGKTYAISGKGGVGKTTLAALMVAHLQKKDTVLAIDADPNTNLNDALGVPLGQTLGGLREDLLENVDNIPGGMSKAEYIKYQLQMALVEGENFDFLAMGRQEGPGCYCYVNNLLRTFMDGLADKYNYVVMDNEAGMEHLSRRTTRNVDILFVVSDTSKVGLMTAARIKKLSEDMELNIHSYVLVLNRVTDSPNLDSEAIAQAKFDYVVTVPFDPQIEKISMEGKSVMHLPQDSKGCTTVGEIVDKANSF